MGASPMGAGSPAMLMVGDPAMGGAAPEDAGAPSPGGRRRNRGVPAGMMGPPMGGAGGMRATGYRLGAQLEEMYPQQLSQQQRQQRQQGPALGATTLRRRTNFHSNV